jgi:hypothetical protein
MPGDRIAAYDPSTRPLGVAILKTMRAVRGPGRGAQALRELFQGSVGWVAGP